MCKIKTFFYLVLLILFSINLRAQGGFIRSIQLPGVKLQVSHSVMQLPNGHYLHIGLTLDTIGNSQVQRLCIMGLNSTGQIAWVKKYGGVNQLYYDITPLGHCLIEHKGFYFYATNVHETGINKGALLKLNMNGDTLWQKRYLSHNSEILVIEGVNRTYDEGFLLFGRMDDQIGNTRLLLIKTDASGNELWRQVINKSTTNGPNYQTVKKVIQDSASKKIILVGEQFIGNSTSWSSHPNIVITDSLGNFLERRSYPNNYTRGILSDIIQTKDGKFVTVGFTSYEKQGVNLLLYGYAVKFDLSNPTFLWQKTYMDEKSIVNNYSRIIEKKNGDLVLAGTQDTSHLMGIAMRNMGKITWLTSSGQTIKKRYYNYIPITNTNGIFADLLYSFNSTSDNGFIGCYYDNGGGQLQRKFFIVKYDSLGCDTSAFYCATVGIKENSYYTGDVSIYPQPANQTINLSSQLFSNKSAQIQLSNNLGQLCFKQNIKFNNGNAQIPLGDLPKGIYLLKLIDEDLKTFTQKLIVE